MMRRQCEPTATISVGLILFFSPLLSLLLLYLYSTTRLFADADAVTYVRVDTRAHARLI